MTSPNSADQQEINKFAAMASEWWDPKGKFAPLHKMNPLRLRFVRDRIAQHFDLAIDHDQPLKGLTLLDIGCGGGLVCEPMARLGAKVTGLDLVQQSIEIARTHAIQSGLTINYQPKPVEELAAEGQKFDVVLALEVVEHVADLEGFLETCAQVLKPEGLMIVSTLNRTLKSYALGIVAAEYILRWLPAGTHDWSKFLKPKELQKSIEDTGLDVVEMTGAVFNPVTNTWSLSKDVDVNYFTVVKNLRACPPVRPHQVILD